MKSSTLATLQQYNQRHPFIQNIAPVFQEAIVQFVACFSNGGKLLVCGNGGSCSDAGHIVGELVKAFKLIRPLDTALDTALRAQGAEGVLLCEKLQGGLPAIDLGAQTALLTAMINDVGGEYVFAQQVVAYGCPGDVLLAISTSGNSKDILHAAAVAKAKGMQCIGLTGQAGGAMKELFDVTLCAPSTVTEDIQDMHSVIYHAICAALECEFWGK